MFTVAILVNGRPIYARTAVNQTQRNDKGETQYRTDCGRIVWHNYDEGAVALAHKLLDTIDLRTDRDPSGPPPPGGIL